MFFFFLKFDCFFNPSSLTCFYVSIHPQSTVMPTMCPVFGFQRMYALTYYILPELKKLFESLIPLFIILLCLLCVSEREHSLFDTRATLEKTLERLDITNGETSEKVTAALDIASDLRKAVEDRDAELRHLRTSHDLLQSRASELEKRLSSSTDSVVRNLRAREEGLEQMRIQNAQLQHALADASEQLQAARRESEERSEQVRRLKYELELSYERDRYDLLQEFFHFSIADLQMFFFLMLAT